MPREGQMGFCTSRLGARGESSSIPPWVTHLHTLHGHPRGHFLWQAQTRQLREPLSHPQDKYCHHLVENMPVKPECA